MNLDDTVPVAEEILSRYHAALAQRGAWEDLWQDCYDYALPQRGGSVKGAGSRRGERLYDATALDAVDQLSASLLGNMTPPLTPWFGFRAGPDVRADDVARLSPVLETSARILQSHIDQSNFIVEVHQAYLDLIVSGTASLAIEETSPGALSAFRFTAIPLTTLVLEEGQNGFLDTVYRVLDLTVAQIRSRYPMADISAFAPTGSEAVDPSRSYKILEAVVPTDHGYAYTVCRLDSADILFHAVVPSSPFLAFRWMKSPGESYGRSPIMKTLPDIKTANKVVELILKNASIAVSGIWQAEHDGVINPANIALVPGAIIPKAVGSKGLTPLEMPGRFDVSQLVINDLRARIRHALLVDRLPQLDGGRMTATEILERTAEMALLLGATYGRLQSEFLVPLIQRCYDVLRRRGVIPDLPLDGRMVEIEFRSPLARAQSQRHVQNLAGWISHVTALGPAAGAFINVEETVKYMAGVLGVPAQLVKISPSQSSYSQGE